MTTTIDRRRAESSPPRATGTGVTQRRVLAAEGIKLRSQRSATWILVGSALSIVAAGVLPALALVLADPSPAGQEGTDPTGGALSGVSFAQLLIGALGILMVSNEYATGLIRTTLTAVPRRLPVLWAKAILAGAIAFVAALTAVLVAFFTARAVLASADTSVSLGTPGVPRAIVGSALLLGITAVLGVSLGSLARSTTGAMAALFGVLYMLPLLGLLLPAVLPYLPGDAGSAILQVEPAGGALPPWIGLGLFTAYTAAALTVAALLLRRRDA